MNVEPKLRSGLVAGGAVLLCIGLTACSGSSKTTAAPPAAAASGTSSSAGAFPRESSSAAGQAGGATSLGSGHPCALLTQAEASAAVGQTVNPGVENVPLGMCTYGTADFSSGVDITVGTWDSISAAAKAGKATPSPVSGVGDEALNLNGSNGSLLYVRKGSTGFLLIMHGPSIDSLPDHGLAKEEAVAALILPRL